MFDVHRRRFLKAVAGAGLAGAGLRGIERTAAAEKMRRKFKMSLACDPIGVRADLRESIRPAAQSGFEAVAPSAHALSKLSAGEVEEVLSDLRARKLTWGAAGLPVDFRSSEERFRVGLEQLPEMAKGLERAGVTRVVTWLSPSHKNLPYLANLRQHARRLRQAAEVLGDHGQRLGLEYVGPKTSWTASRFPFIHTMAGLKELLAEIDRRNVGFLLDSWHWYHARETAEDILALTNEDVVGCHLNDAPKGIPLDQQRDGRRELPAATGVIDLRAFLAALATIGYDGPICAEPFNAPLRAMPREEALAATAAAMKKAFALVE